MKNRKLLIVAGGAVLALVVVGLLSIRNPEGPRVAAAASPAPVAAATNATTRILAGGPRSSAAATAPAPVPATQTPTKRGTLPYVLTSKAPFDKPLRLVAESLGAKTVSSQGRRALLIEADSAARARIKADARFEDVVELSPSAKIQPALASLVKNGAKAVEVSILSLEAADRESVVALLEKSGGEMLTGCINEGDTIRAKIPSDCVATLAGRGEVRWMESFVRPKFMNDIAVNAPQMNVREVWDTHELTGLGQEISTSDAGIDSGDPATLHEDLRNQVKDMKVVSGCNTTDSNGHGTHTAGSIVGNGTKSGGKIKGTAYEANLYAWFCCGTDGYVYTPTAMNDLYRNNGAWPTFIHSASWGSAVGGEYTTACYNHDLYVWQNPEFLPVFAAGNEGCNDSGTVVYSMSISSPGSAKNVLTVGATQNGRKGYDGGWGNGDPTKTVIFSSRGPCQDGRTKPDIAAPGSGVLSTRSHGVKYNYGIYDEFYAYDSGTSMATPLTAGSVALVRQWLVEKKHFDGTTEIAEGVTNKLPTAALMKAVIMGGAKGASVPNNNQGWGRVDLESTLFPSNCAVKLIDRIPFAAGFETNIVIETTNAAPLNVQLVWVDYPGSASADQSVSRLVNDLDLTVETAAEGVDPVLYGNGGTEPDTLNNAESVRIASAPVAKYVITVNCKTVLHDHTEGGAAALYVRGAFEADAEPAVPEYVRLRKKGKSYLSLDRALMAVRDDDETVEILAATRLQRSVTLTNRVTFVTTNADVLASAITRSDGAAITLADGAELTLSNFVFAASAQQPAIVVEAGAKLRLAATNGVGTVRTADANGLDVVGPYVPAVDGVMVDCPVASALGDAFGTFSCDYETASNAVGRIYNANDEDLGGVADEATGKLKWSIVTVPLEDAKCIVKTGSGTFGYRTFATALKAVMASGGQLTITENVTHTNTVTLTHDLILASENGAVLSFTADAGFVVPTGSSLLLTNITVSGADVSIRDCAFKVTGGDLTLEKGATLADFSDEESRKDYSAYWGGTVVAWSGSVTMKSGSLITNCVSHSQGGAIWLNSKKATANLLGGTIADCAARSSEGGGAVYVGYLGAYVNLAGDFTATDNTMGPSDNAKTGNLYLSRLAVLTLAGELTGEVGVSFSIKDGYSDLNVLGANFIALGSGVTEAQAIASAECFSHDAEETFVGQYDVDTATIVWAEIDDGDDGQCAKVDAGVRVKVDGESDYRYYLCIDDAFEYVKTNATFEVKGTVYNYYLDGITKDVTIDHDVRITSWGEDIMILWRACHAMYKVVAGGSLTLANVKIVGAYSYDSGYDPWDDEAGHAFTPLFYDEDDFGDPIAVEEPSKGLGLISVDGGSLTLEDGARVGFVFGNVSRASNAITVFNGGTVTMESGSRVTEVYNEYQDDYETSCGGGILLDRSTGYFEGGAIYNCKAYRAGGLYVANESTAYLSGDIYIGCNYAYKDDNEDNIVVSKNSNLVLAGPLASVDPCSEDPENPDSGYIGVNEGIAGDTSCFATVDWEWTDFDELEGSAEYFLHDRRGGGYVYGVPVTNWNAKTQHWDARLVWNDSLSLANGITIDGKTYRGAIPAGLSVAVPKAFSVTPTTGANGKQVLSLDGGVEGCWYTVYSTTDLTTPFTKESSVQLKAGETFEYDVDQTKDSKFYKIVAEEGLK